MSERIPLLIDTDPGVDDALALLMAFDDPGHEVVGLTVVAGNVGLEHTLRNALQLCEVAGRRDVPVYPGCVEPLLHPAPDAADVHGEDGFGDSGYEPAGRAAETEHAAQAIVSVAREHEGRLLLVALGPLTNLALALKLDPALPRRVGRLVVMGGAVTGQGNITPAAEFNIAFDPEAAAIVFDAFGRVDLCDWEATLRHGLPHDRVEDWLRADSPRAAFYEAISRHTRHWASERRGNRWHSADGLAMALALQPQGVEEAVGRPLAIELAPGPARGATVVDWDCNSGRRENARILQRYDQARFEGMVRGALAAR